jgi:DNA mismatch endonuclease (patch repair protein)
MSKITGKDSKPEILVRKYLFSKGFRYRKNDRKLSGSPDLVLPKYKTLIFINGCFWHGHSNCKKAKLPASNRDFWSSKICKNIERDTQNYIDLKKMGWNIIIVWQCNISSKKKRDEYLPILSQLIKDNKEL